MENPCNYTKVVKGSPSRHVVGLGRLFFMIEELGNIGKAPLVKEKKKWCCMELKGDDFCLFPIRIRMVLTDGQPLPCAEKFLMGQSSFLHNLS